MSSDSQVASWVLLNPFEGAVLQEADSQVQSTCGGGGISPQSTCSGGGPGSPLDPGMSTCSGGGISVRQAGPKLLPPHRVPALEWPVHRMWTGSGERTALEEPEKQRLSGSVGRRSFI